MPVLAAPAVLHAGTMSASASTTRRRRVTVRSRATVSGFNLLGLLKIDSIVTDLTATSDGGPPRPRAAR